MSMARYFTSSDWVNKKEVELGPWPSQRATKKQSGDRSRVNAGGTNKAKMLLRKLDKGALK